MILDIKKQNKDQSSKIKLILFTARQGNTPCLRSEEIHSIVHWGGGESQCQKGVATGHHDDHAH